MADREYKDINAIAAEMKPLPTPCELAAENDRLMQKVSALCKERDELKKTLYEERARHRTEYCESAEYDCVALGKLRKDNERLRHALNQTIVMLNDETVRAEAAIADMKRSWLCEICKNKTSENVGDACEKVRPVHLGLGKKEFTCANFEWRGAQEREER